MSFFMKSKVLIVDDEPPILKLLQKILAVDGHTCVKALSVSDAMSLMRKERFDLVITDWKVAKESGMDLLKYAAEFHPLTGRMMMTGFSSMEAAQEALQIGVYGYLVKPLGGDMVRIAVQNALRHMLLENQMQACLNEAQKEAFEKNITLEGILNNIDTGVVVVNRDMRILSFNRTMEIMFPEIKAQTTRYCFDVFSHKRSDKFCSECPMAKAFQTNSPVNMDRIIHTSEGYREFKISAVPLTEQGSTAGRGILIYHDVTEIMESQKIVSDSNKLIAVGQLAAGIAHEINTPIQFLGDNIRFLQESFEELQPLFAVNQEISGKEWEKPETLQKQCARLKEEVENVDLEFVLEEIPKATQQSLDGVQRISDIVKAMKDFSHPGDIEKTFVNINELIQNTVIVCKNEWKYVAEIEYMLDESLPLVECLPSELSQVILILVVNAAHSIEEKNSAGKSRMGLVQIRTRMLEHNEIEIVVRDTGVGIPEDIQNKIFEVFFTTKKRGKGTGQGLSMARNIIMEKHGGTLSFNSEVGEGTAFCIRLPIQSS